MVEAWFDFDEIAGLEEKSAEDAVGADEDLKSDPNVVAGLVASADAESNAALPDGGLAAGVHIIPVEDRTNAVLYIVQFDVAVAPQQVWLDAEPSTLMCKKDLDQGRTLVYLPNGVCLALEEDPKRSVWPAHREWTAYQTKCGRSVDDAAKIQSWEAATQQPLFRFRTAWHFKALPDGKSTRVTCNLSEFEQYQMRELDLGELVINHKDIEISMLVQKYNGPGASVPPDYVIFNAPATAALLQAASDGNVKALPGILAKRADPNFPCEPSGYDGELTPLMAAVRARSSPCVRFLLQDAGADANIPCRCGDGASAGFCTAVDMAEEDAELASLLRSVGALPIAQLDTAGLGSAGGAAAGGPAVAEGVDAMAFEAAVVDLTKELRRIRGLSSGEQRGAFRRLLLQWHPDKNPQRQALATSVFQWLQTAALQVHRRSAGGVHWRTSAKAASKPRRAPRADARRSAPDVKPGAVIGKMSVAMKICARHWSLEFLDLLVEQGESVRQLDDSGRSALFYAVRGMRDPNGNLVGRAQLSYTAEFFWRHEEQEEEGDDEGAPDMISVMVEDFGADVNEADHAKMTPLMEAARFGNAFACHRLVQLKADVLKRNSAGHTAIEIAETCVPSYLSSLEAGSDTDGVWHRVQIAINRDRALVASFLKQSLTRGGALTGGGPRLQLR